MEAFLVSTAIVALGEMGDKTQLLALVLAARLKRRVPIAFGILAATLANHLLAGSLGAWLASLVPPGALRIGVGLAFVGFGVWSLKPDTLDEDRPRTAGGAFLTTLVSFFLVEMGDKTQLATIALAARFRSLVPVVCGTTLGMMVADVPAVWLGAALARRLNMSWLRYAAATLFVLLGVLTLLAGPLGAAL